MPRPTAGLVPYEMDAEMKILSLCSGYGGLDMAVEQHFSAKTAYWSDIDKTACDVMSARFPDAQPIGDLTTLDLTMIHADVLTAGYPCQPFSTAGNRLGEKDERHLWPYIRNTISVLRPRFVVLENVAGHLSMGAAAVVGDLAALGYDAQWTVVRASDVGAPHQRKRLFIVADADGGTGEKFHLGDGDRGRPQTRLDRKARTNFERLSLPSEFERYRKAVTGWQETTGRRAPVPVKGSRITAEWVEWMMGVEKGWVCDIAPNKTQALRLLANGVVPQQAKRALELLT